MLSKAKRINPGKFPGLVSTNLYVPIKSFLRVWRHCRLAIRVAGAHQSANKLINRSLLMIRGPTVTFKSQSKGEEENDAPHYINCQLEPNSKHNPCPVSVGIGVPSLTVQRRRYVPTSVQAAIGPFMLSVVYKMRSLTPLLPVQIGVLPAGKNGT